MQARLVGLGVGLERLHPESTDPELATYAVTHVDEADAESILQQLTQWQEVEGAYAKPRGEPP